MMLSLLHARDHRHDAQVLVHGLGAVAAAASSTSTPCRSCTASAPWSWSPSSSCTWSTSVASAGAWGGRGRRCSRGPNSIVFNKNDLKEAGQSIKWFFGRGPRPQFGRYTYWEKFDYLAVFWGVFVIGLTGLMRWFPEFFTHVMPGLVRQRRHDHPQRRGAAGRRLHLHDPLLQHALPAGQVPDGPGDLHRPRHARGAEVRQAARVRADGGERRARGAHGRPVPRGRASGPRGSSASSRWASASRSSASIVYSMIWAYT